MLLVTLPPRCLLIFITEAALNNPNVSEEAKQRSRAAVEDLQESGEYEPQESFKNAGNVAGGHKVRHQSFYRKLLVIYDFLGDAQQPSCL